MGLVLGWSDGGPVRHEQRRGWFGGDVCLGLRGYKEKGSDIVRKAGLQVFFSVWAMDVGCLHGGCPDVRKPSQLCFQFVRI